MNKREEERSLLAGSCSQAISKDQLFWRKNKYFRETNLPNFFSRTFLQLIRQIDKYFISSCSQAISKEQLFGRKYKYFWEKLLGDKKRAIFLQKKGKQGFGQIIHLNSLAKRELISLQYDTKSRQFQKTLKSKLLR